MRTTGTIATGLSLLLAATACSSGTAKVLVQDTPTPAISVSTTPSTASTPSSTPAGAGTHRATRTHVTATTSSPASGATASATPAATRPAASAAPRPTATPIRTTVSACTVTGSTTSVQMVTGDRFQPAALTINRCDAVKAVYADTTGVPHNWQGHGWTSPDMTGAGQSYTYRFTSTGTFGFFCSYHQSVGMTGTVTVR